MKSLFFAVAALCFFWMVGVTRADDHGDTRQTATTITARDTAGNLDTAQDEDWFRIVITQAGRVWIYSTGNTDTRGFLYTDAGAYIDQDDESGAGGTGSNFLFNRVFQPGTYYLRVDDGGTGNLTGPYTVSIRSPENSIAFAPAVTPNLDANLDVLGDHDYYRIDIAKAGRVWIYTTGNADTRGFLYTDAGAYIDQDDESGAGGTGSNFLLNRVLQPGSYYLLVDDGGTGNLTGAYTLSVRTIDDMLGWSAGDGGLGEPVVLDVVELGRRQRLEDRLRLGALHGEETDVVTHVGQVAVEPADVLLDVREVLVLVRSVHDHHQVVGGVAVDEAVVDEGPLLG